MYDETAQVDLQLLLSHIQLRDEAKVIVDRAIVAMPPTQAKLLSVVLSDNVKKWEATYGEIKTPPLK